MTETYDSIRTQLAARPAELVIPVGRHVIAPPPDVPAIQPLADVVIRGAGMDETALVFPIGVDGLFAQGVSITISDLEITRDQMQTTQGRVTETGRNYAILDIPANLPAPVFDPDRPSSKGRDLRPFTDHRRPRLMVDEEQWNWSAVEYLGGTLWKFTLNRKLVDIPLGRLMAVKSKYGNADPYRFTDCDVTMERVRFTRDARGLFINCWAIVRSCAIVREERWHCFSTNSGGWQFANSEIRVENNIVQATADDPIACYDGTRGVIRGNTITDTWRGMVIVGASTELVTVESNRLNRCEVHYYPGK